ncbi:MAG TPA: TonB family protein [Bryobacteraceae bacterium]|nr:TonB family protein [Bryobacteraceae bacterium]
MYSHADTFDRPERLTKQFWASVVLHVSFAAVCLTSTLIGSHSTVQWGDPHGGGMGSVAITPVASIKLPHESAAFNPVANDTESQVPEPPSKKKPAPKVKAPDPDAIAIKNPRATKKSTERAQSSAPNKFRDQQQDRPNQLYTEGGQKTSSPMYNIQGGGGLQLGNDSVFGTQFGAYANLLRNAVARNWNTSGFDTRVSVPPAVVTFIIRRDGSLAPGSVKLTERSGNAALDISAQRAIQDAAPFPPLPPGFPKSEAQVELRFNLKF